MTEQYKVISDNLGEYSVITKDNVIVSTEIQHRITAETFCEELNILADENEQLKEENKELKERNNRQAKQLNNLYNLIEKQDWKTLTGLIEELQECEEQLQREWKCYE